MEITKKKKKSLNIKRRKDFIIQGLTIVMGILAIGIYVFTRNRYITIFLVLVCFIISLIFIEKMEIYNYGIKGKLSSEKDTNKIKAVVKPIDKEGK